MRNQANASRSHNIQLATTGIVVLLVLVLSVLQLSTWVTFAVIWLIPLGLGLASLSMPDSCFDPMRGHDQDRS